MIHVCHHSSVHAHVGPEPSSAQKRKRSQTDEELADYRQLRKLFKLEKGDNASEVLAPLVEVAPLVCPALHDPATHAPLRSSPRLVEAPGQSGTAATARQRALMNRNHSSRPRRRRQARALHQRGVELPAAGPSAMQVPVGLLRQARVCLNRILIIKTELRSIIPGVPILGAL